MTGVYSKRFLAFTGDGNAHTASVPAGKVWIIDTVTACTSATSGQIFAAFDVAGVHVWLWAGTGQTLWQSGAMTRAHIVANPGDVLSGYVSANTGAMTVSGYELNA